MQLVRGGHAYLEQEVEGIGLFLLFVSFASFKAMSV